MDNKIGTFGFFFEFPDNKRRCSLSLKLIQFVSFNSCLRPH